MLQVCYSGSWKVKRPKQTQKNPNLNFPFKKIKKKWNLWQKKQWRSYIVQLWSFDRICDAQ